MYYSLSNNHFLYWHYQNALRTTFLKLVDDVDHVPVLGHPVDLHQDHELRVLLPLRLENRLEILDIGFLEGILGDPPERPVGACRNGTGGGEASCPAVGR